MTEQKQAEFLQGYYTLRVPSANSTDKSAYR